MPTYLCHGFRWQRRSIRVYVILQNLDDASPDWIIPARTSNYILSSFYDIFDFLPYCSPAHARYDPEDDWAIRDRSQSRIRSRSQSRSRARSRSQSAASHHCHSRAASRTGPHQFLPPLPVTAADDDCNIESAAADSDDDFAAQSWSAIKLLEEYDPRDLSAVSRPYAYVADYAVRIDLSCNIAEEIARYEQLQLQSQYPAIGIPSAKDGGAAPEPGWFERLRDELQRGEEIQWYVVVNNDETRDWADGGSELEVDVAPPPPLASTKYETPRPHPYHPRAQLRRQPSSYMYQAPPSRPLPTIEQKHHHAQYLLQQSIFEMLDQESQGKQSPDQSPQIQEQSPSPPPSRAQQHQLQQPPQIQVTPEQREQERKKAEEELKRQKQLLFEKAEQKRRKEEQEQQQQRQKDQQLAALQKQQLDKEREIQRQKEKEKQLALERQQQHQKRKEESKQQQRQQQQQQQQQPPPPQRQAPLPPNNNNSNAAKNDDDDDHPPPPPEKDIYYFPRPPTSTTAGTGTTSYTTIRNRSDTATSVATTASTSWNNNYTTTPSTSSNATKGLRTKMSFDAGMLGKSYQQPQQQNQYQQQYQGQNSNFAGNVTSGGNGQNSIKPKMSFDMGSIRPKMSFDGISRPKTPGSLRIGNGGGGGFRRLFGRNASNAKVAAVDGYY